MTDDLETLKGLAPKIYEDALQPIRFDLTGRQEITHEMPIRLPGQNQTCVQEARFQGYLL